MEILICYCLGDGSYKPGDLIDAEVGNNGRYTYWIDSRDIDEVRSDGYWRLAVGLEIDLFMMGHKKIPDMKF